LTGEIDNFFTEITIPNIEAKILSIYTVMLFSKNVTGLILDIQKFERNKGDF